MSEFDLTIIHVPEKTSIVADALLHHADLHLARVATISISLESDLLATICLSQEQDSLAAFRDSKHRALAHNRGMRMQDGLVYRTLHTGGQTVVITNYQALK